MQSGKFRVPVRPPEPCRQQADGEEPATLRVVFAGGGTGGHLFPGLAVAEWLSSAAPSVESFFIGTDRAVEERILATSPFVHAHVALAKADELGRHGILSLLRRAHALGRLVVFSRRLLRRIAPAVVVGLGGAASVPTVLAARSLGLPVVLLEQNVIPGRANRFLARWADAVCVGFPPAAEAFGRARRVVITGNPVRRVIAALVDRSPTDRATDALALDRSRASEMGHALSSAALLCECAACEPPSHLDAVGVTQAGIPAPTPTSPSLRVCDRSLHCLLVLGGSQGSRHLNDAVLEFAARFLPRGWWIWHQTGDTDAERVQNAYAKLGIAACVEAFIEDMAAAWRSAELVVARAGALTISELCCASCASVLIPLPWSADDHQAANARWIQSANAAVCVTQAPTPLATAERLRASALPLIERPELRRCLGRNARRLARPDAAAQVGDIILRLAGRRPPISECASFSPRS